MKSFNSQLTMIFEDLESKMGRATNMLLSKKSRWPGKDEKLWPQLSIVATTPVEAAQDWIRVRLQQLDPTPQKQYILYIVKQVALGLLHDIGNDGPLVKDALEIFHSKGPDWPGHKDVFQYKKWRDLQKETMNYTEARSKVLPASTREVLNKYKKEAREGADLIIDDDIPILGGGSINFKVYVIRNFAASIILGKGTQWCTNCSVYKDQKTQGSLETYIPKWVHEQFFQEKHRYEPEDPKNRMTGTPWEGWAKDDFISEIYRLNNWPVGKPLSQIKDKTFKAPNPYLLDAKSTYDYYSKGEESLIMIYKNGKPYVQLTMSGSEIKDVEDVELGLPSPALSRVLIAIPKKINVPKSYINRVYPKVRRAMDKFGISRK